MDVRVSDSMKYEINEMVPDTFLDFDYDFTTGQRAYLSFEIRKFKEDNGGELLVYSRSAGIPDDFSEEESSKKKRT